MKRVVITGMGAINSLGDTLPECWSRLVAGANGIALIDFFNAAAYNTRVAGQVRRGKAADDANGFSKDFSPEETGLEQTPVRLLRRGSQLFLKAAREAWADAGFTVCPPDPASTGVSAGTSVNFLNQARLREQFDHQIAGGRLNLESLEPRLDQHGGDFLLRSGDMAPAVAARNWGLRGPVLAIDTACAASGHAIGEAFRLIRSGRTRVMLAGGGSALVGPLAMLAFAVLGALSKSGDPETASRPFDRDRDGFVMGEGAAVLVLEELDAATARGARIYAELAGFGSTTTAGNLTDPSPDGSAEAGAMQMALNDGGIAPEEIGFVAAHGTSTPKNDAVETAAIKKVFGAHAGKLAVSSCKGQIGHTISAAAAFNLIHAVKAIEGGVVPPTMHLNRPDPQCDLNYVANQPQERAVRAALANSFAFGGQNAVLAVRAWESPAASVIGG